MKVPVLVDGALVSALKHLIGDSDDAASRAINAMLADHLKATGYHARPMGMDQFDLEVTRLLISCMEGN